MFMRLIFCAILSDKTDCCQVQTRTEHLLIYRIPSHTNPKRRKFCMKRTGQKSFKEELLEVYKATNRAEKLCLKVKTYFWVQEARGSSPRTPAIKGYRRKPIAFFFLLVKEPMKALTEAAKGSLLPENIAGFQMFVCYFATTIKTPG